MQARSRQRYKDAEREGEGEVEVEVEVSGRMSQTSSMTRRCWMGNGEWGIQSVLATATAMVETNSTGPRFLDISTAITARRHRPWSRWRSASGRYRSND